MSTRAELYGSTGFRLAGALRAGFVAVTVAGGVAAIATGGADWSALPLVVGATGALAAQLTVGILGYRRAMRREWPKVGPVSDDEDW
jgi:hypothetical protein